MVPGTVAVRDSKDPEGPKLVFGRRAFASFLVGIKR
ncbi:regulator [Actinomadura verrucosospora]|uniref:Regulator n=1 Tax=Actinomadura verrucosospora TaxID=46165 RepID=A0A7D3VZU4_ACTVE|nr:regulator [Actinomadura verrucosospora]